MKTAEILAAANDLLDDAIQLRRRIHRQPALLTALADLAVPGGNPLSGREGGRCWERALRRESGLCPSYAQPA